MKLKIKIISGFLIAVISYIIFIQYHDSTFVESNFKKYTGVTEYIIKVNYHNDFQSYIETVISNSSKRTLLQKFKFESNLSKLKGRIEPAFLTESDKFIYYIIEDGYGPYGYIVFELEKEGNTFIVYEEYGN